MPGAFESLFEEAELTVLGVGEVDCPFHYPDFDTSWRGNVAAGPLQGVIRQLGEEKVWLAPSGAAEAFRRGDGSVSIQPGVFKYVVAR